jgi:sugar lactone lactonase YvrE
MTPNKEEHMNKLLTGFISLLLVGAGMGAVWADDDRDDDRDAVRRFVTLPEGPGHPEGIAADRWGNIYVATFEFTQPNVIHVFGRHGRLRLTIPVPGVPLGMEFDAAGNLYVANFGGGSVLRFSPPFTAASVPSATFPVCGGPGAGCGLNAIAFDSNGDLYVSDSFGGRVFKIDFPGGTVSEFFAHDLLKPGSHGFPGFGANGLAFGGGFLYIANTADDRVLRLNIGTMTLSTFAESINGADGIAFDRDGRLWVCANQADEVVALNDKGRVIERLGKFEGIRRDGSPKGLLFPASLVIVGNEMFVTNLALALTEPEPVGDEPEEDVKRWTVSRIKLPH